MGDLHSISAAMLGGHPRPELAPESLETLLDAFGPERRSAKKGTGEQ